MEDRQLKELLIQALEHERGGAKLYEAAIECAENEDLRGEWTKYLDETRHHVQVLEGTVGAAWDEDSDEEQRDKGHYDRGHDHNRHQGGRPKMEDRYSKKGGGGSKDYRRRYGGGDDDWD